MATKEGGGIRPTDRRPRRADERDIPDRLDENIVRTSCFWRGRPSHDLTLLGAPLHAHYFPQSLQVWFGESSVFPFPPPFLWWRA